MRKLTLAAALLVASAGVAGAACMTPYSGMPTGNDCTMDRNSWNAWYTNQYNSADANQDGRVSADEWSAANSDRYTYYYYGIDTNRDGTITVDEWNTAHANRDYNNVDRNQDGMISVEEWQEGYDRDFDNNDVDKNGTLSKDELQGNTQKGS